MSKLIPERPLYKREKIVAGYFALGVIAFLFAARLVASKTTLTLSPFLYKLLFECLIFGVPLLFFYRLRNGKTRALLRAAPLTTHDIPLFLMCGIALFSGCILLAMLFGGVGTLGKSGTLTANTETPVGIFLTALIFGVLPAVAEEFFFRGVLLSEYERRGAFRAVLMSALLFALSHFDFRNLLLYLFSGVLFALLLFATDSIFWGVILHALYNLFFLFFGRYVAALYDFTGSMELFLFLLILAFLLSLLFFCRFAAKRYRAKAALSQSDPRRAVPYAVQFYTTLDALANWPILVSLLLSIAGFILL